MFFSVEAHAQTVLDDYKIPMPDIELMSDEAYNAISTEYKEVPFGDESLSYKIRLPNDWIKETEAGLGSFSVSSKVFGNIARFHGAPKFTGNRSRFTIQVIGLDYQLTAEQWFLQHLLANGYSIQGFRMIDETEAEALFVMIDNSISYVVRASAHISGKSVVLAQHFLPIEWWDDSKVSQAHIVSSFSLLKKEQVFVEEMKFFHFLDVTELQYPASWEMRASPLRSIDNMNVQILNVVSRTNSKYGGGVKFLNGKIDVNLVSVFVADSLEVEKQAYKESFIKAGLVIQDSLNVEEKFVLNKQFSSFKIEAFEAIDTKNTVLDYEVWLASFSAGDYYYFVSLLTPSRDDDFYVWSRNTQTYKLILKLIKPLDESIIER